MLLRPLTIALLLLTSAFALAPSTTAQAIGSCPGADAPYALTPGEAVGGTDAVADAVVATDCYFTVATPGDQTGKQLRVVVTSTSNHDVFVKESVASAAPYACSSTLTTATSDTCTAWWPLVASEYSVRIKRTSTTPSDFSVTAFLEDAPASGCSNGFEVAALTLGSPATGSLADLAGARCTYVLTGVNPLASLGGAGDDVLKSTLTPPAGSNFDINVRKGFPSTAAGVRDCVSALTGVGVVDECEAVLDNGAPVYVTVRRTSGGGDFLVGTALAGSSCLQGSGYHPLANGVDAAGSTRALVGSKCHYKIDTNSVDDLLSVQLTTSVQPGSLSAHTLFLGRDSPIGLGTVDCSGSSTFINFPGILVAQTPYQCDRLLEDGLDHTWYMRVSRAAGGSTAVPQVDFSINALAQAIPTLFNGVAQLGHVDAAQVQYWKVIVPEGATTLLVQSVGDPTNQACSLGPQVNPTVALACVLLPFPSLVGCAVAAGYGVDCAGLTGPLYDTCMAQIDNEEACAEAEAARTEACGRIDEISPGACTAVDPSSASVKLTEMDLLVRHRTGLPTTAVNDCHSAAPGAIEQCLFSALVKKADDRIVDPATRDTNADLAELRQRINNNRVALDAALADLVAVVNDGRGQVEPTYAEVRAQLIELTGQDPGALPGTPAVPAAPTPAVVVPDLLNAKPFPGAGKYFIAVRGPASALLSKGGDYAIVAIHDDVRPPSVGDVQTQVDQAQSGVNDVLGGLGSLPVPIDTSPLAPVVGAANGAIDGVQDALPGDLPLPGELPVPVVVPQPGDGGLGDLLNRAINLVAKAVQAVLNLT